MTREERQALLDKLRADNAETLLDLAARERRTAEGRDPPEWEAPRRELETGEQILRTTYDAAERQERALALVDGFVQKDFSGNGSDVSFMTADTQKHWDDWLQAHLELAADDIGAVIGQNVKKLRDEMRQEAANGVNVLSARLDDVEARLDELDARLDALEGNKGYAG